MDSGLFFDYGLKIMDLGCRSNLSVIHNP